MGHLSKSLGTDVVRKFVWSEDPMVSTGSTKRGHPFQTGRKDPCTNMDITPLKDTERVYVHRLWGWMVGT